MENPPLIMTGLNPKRVIQSLEIVINSSNKAKKIIEDYNEDNVSNKIERIILSYTDYINRFVWQKES